MSEGPESESLNALNEQIEAIFKRRSDAARERGLIKRVYEENFRKMIDTLPSENQDSIRVKTQKLAITTRAVFAEYGARLTDFVRTLVVRPMILATSDFPKDKYYQIELARAKAWTGFAHNTIPTATAERNAYRDNFLPSALSGATEGALVGGFFGIPAGILLGALEGATVGAVAGIGGVVAGTAIGATIGGVGSIGRRIMDRWIGPPVAYYNLDKFIVNQTTNVSVNSSGTATTSSS